MAEFKDLLGLTLAAVERINDEKIRFSVDDGRVFVMEHFQDCCENVTIESVVGDLNDLVGSPITLAEEVTSGDNPPNTPPDILRYQDSFTWTFYKLATIKGYVDIRWYGESNGYYSESVDFHEEGKGRWN